MLPAMLVANAHFMRLAVQKMRGRVAFGMAFQPHEALIRVLDGLLASILALFMFSTPWCNHQVNLTVSTVTTQSLDLSM